MYYRDWLNDHGYSVLSYISNFNHFTKRSVEDGVNIPFSLIHVPEYKRNISFMRIISHVVFSMKVMFVLLREKPNVLIGVIPCNSLGVVLWLYKKINRKCKIAVDIVDMWPESLPSKFIKRYLFLFMGLWRYLRRIGIKAADRVFCECFFFANELIKQRVNNKIEIIYLSGEARTCKKTKCYNNGVLHIVYLGSINNIIDIDRIAVLVKEILKIKPVELDIIGGGSSCDEFVKKIKNTGAKVVLHGMIFDDNKKKEIISRCKFGLNIMKPTVFVGLTTKSIEYSLYGLPILNSIPGDSKRLIDIYNSGINIDFDDVTTTARKICALNDEKYYFMKMGARNMFNNEFSDGAIKGRVNDAFSKWLI